VTARLRRWLERRRPPFTPDHCRVCDVQLRRGRVWEVRGGFAVHVGDEMVEVDEAMMRASATGGTWSAITYCRRHAPKGAVRS